MEGRQCGILRRIKSENWKAVWQRVWSRRLRSMQLESLDICCIAAFSRCPSGLIRFQNLKAIKTKLSD